LELLVDRVAVGTEGQEAHDGSRGGDDGFGITTSLIYALCEGGAASASAAWATAAGPVATGLSGRAMMVAAPAVFGVAGHIDAFGHPFVADDYIAALVTSRTGSRGTTAGIVCLSGTSAAAAYSGPALIEARAAVVRVRLEIGTLSKWDSAFRDPLTTDGSRRTGDACVAPGAGGYTICKNNCFKCARELGIASK
jgi:hypothetical protein